jgi:hypothetical protein
MFLFMVLTMSKLSTLTIAIKTETLDKVRTLSVKNYRSLSKQIALILETFLTQQGNQKE